MAPELEFRTHFRNHLMSMMVNYEPFSTHNQWALVGQFSTILDENQSKRSDAASTKVILRKFTIYIRIYAPH